MDPKYDLSSRADILPSPLPSKRRNTSLSSSSLVTGFGVEDDDDVGEVKELDDLDLAGFDLERPRLRRRLVLENHLADAMFGEKEGVLEAVRIGVIYI